MECVFACDVGTSSLKAALIPARGEVLNFLRLPFPSNPTADDWLSVLYAALEKCETFAGENEVQISGLCISGNGPSLVVEESKCSGATRLFIWNESTRDVSLSKEETSLLKKLTESGSLFLPRIFLFSKKYPEAFTSARFIFSAPEYIAYRLTGEAATFLPTERCKKAYWTRNTLEMFGRGLEERLPEFLEAGKLLGRYKGTPVFAGVPDFFAALIGTGTIVPNAACDRAGTSEGLNLCLAEKPIFCRTAALRILPSLTEPNWNAACLLGETGRVLKKAIATCKQNQTGTNSESKKILQQYALNLNQGIAHLEKIAGKKLSFTLSGGQADDERLNQFKADVTGRRFVKCQTAACELLGDACLAFFGLGVFPSVQAASQALVRYMREYVPRQQSF